MLLEAVGDRGPKKSAITPNHVATALLSASRDTDSVGWYKEGAIVGTMFTGLIVTDKRAVLDTFWESQRRVAGGANVGRV